MQRIPVEVNSALQEVARKNHTTVEVVRKEIELAIQVGMSDCDPAIQERWKEILCEGEMPTPEQVILFLAQKIF